MTPSIAFLSKNKKWLLLTTAITFVFQQESSVHGMDLPNEQQALQEVPSVPLVTPHDFDFQMEPPNLPSKLLYSKQIKDLPEALREEQNRLHQSLLISLEAKEDLWSPLIQEIKKAFRTESSMIQEAAKEIFPNLVEPTLSLWPPDLLREHDTLHHSPSLTSDHPGFERINSVISILKTLAENPATSPALSSKLHELGKIYCIYRGDFCQISPFGRGPLLFPVLMKTEFSDKTYLISRKKAYELLSIDQYGIPTKKNQTGSSIVTHIGEIYAKQNLIKKRQDGSQEGTLNPALEWGMSAFHRLLFGEGLVSSALVSLPHVPLDGGLQGVKGQEKQRLIDKAKDVNLSATDRPAIQNRLCEEQSFKSGFPYTLQITPEVEGVFIQDFLKEALNKPSLFEELDPYNLQSILLSSLLTNPADAKGDNLMVTSPDSTGRSKIISIDNDLALSSFIIEEQPDYHSLEARNILFAIPRFMEQTIEESVKQRFLSHSPYLFLLHWLKALDYHQQQYKALLEQNFIDKQAYDNLSLPLQLKGGTIKHVLEKFLTIQKLISSSPSVTFQQLFEELSPLAAQTYKILRERHDPLKAFEIIYRQDKFLEEVLNAGEKKEVQTLLDKEHNLKNAYKDRAQGLEGAVLELCEATDLRHLEEKTRLQFFEDVYLSFPSALKAVKHPSWRDPSLLYLGTGFPISSITLKFLIKKFSQYINIPDKKRGTPLHCAVEQESRKALQFAGILLAKGANPEIKNPENLTPLDMAMKKKDSSLFEFLITKGSGLKTNPIIALKFYQDVIKTTKNSETMKAFLQLARINDEVRWHVCLEEMIPVPIPGRAARPISTAKFLKRTLPRAIRDQIITDDGTWVPYSQDGNHIVSRATFINRTLGIEHSLYFKVYPELPGIEEAVGLFTRKLLGCGAPHTELAKINDAPVLISHSHGTKDKTLDYMLRHHPNLLKNLDEESLSGLILVAMLINPEDGKPSNYVVEPLPSNPKKYRIVGIDNDHAFVPAIVMEKPQKKAFSQRPIPVAQVKTILYCLEQMKNPVHSNIRNLFINLRPDEILDEWLGELKKINASYSSLFPDPQDRKKLSTTENHQYFLGVPFQKGAIAHLYDKLVNLQNALNQSPGITHLELLMKLEPRLAKRYQLASHLPTVKERWDTVDADFYEKTRASSGTTLTRSCDILRSMNIPLEESVLESICLEKNLGPVQAIEELKAIKEELQTKTLIALGARAGDLNFLKTLQLESTRAKFLEATNFKGLTPQEQEAILDYLKGKQLRQLTLKNCQSLNDSRIIQGFTLNHLTKLDLRGCEQITYRSLLHLSQVASNLEELNLANITSLQEIGDIGAFVDGPLIFKELRFLNLNNCINLTKVLLQAPKLHYLNIENCSLLTDQMLDGVLEGSKNLTKLCLTGAAKISEIFFREEYPTFILTDTRLSAIEQFNLGVKYSSGKGVLQNYEEAVKWFQKAANQGNADAQKNLGVMYANGNGVLQSYEQAVKWFQKAAGQGSADAQVNLGWMYYNGKGVPQDYEQAVKWFQKAADQGDADAQSNLGAMYANAKGVPQDYNEALKWYQKAADQGNADAQVNLGWMYYNGKGVPQDYNEALKRYQKAADQGNAAAQVNLGWMYYNGKDIPQDYEQAIKWFQKAADQGDADAQKNLGAMYEDGKGVLQDYEQAVKWYRLAADQGNADAQYNLGAMYANGKGVPQDYNKALKWYQKAADQGNPAAQANLGWILNSRSF